MKTDVAARRLERLERERRAGGRRTRGPLDRSSRGQDKSHEAGRRQVVCRQGLRLWQSPDWRERLHPRQRRARRRRPHDEHRRVCARRERRCLSLGGGSAWKEERDKEKASNVTQQVTRAAAPTAELAAQSENKVSVLVCVTSQPNQIASRRWPRAARSPWPRAVFSARATAFPQQAQAPSVSHEFRGAQPRTAHASQEAAAVLGGTVSFHVKATGKDESSMWRQLAKKKLEDLRRSRDHWRTCAEESNASKTRRQRGFLPKTKGCVRAGVQA